MKNHFTLWFHIQLCVIHRTESNIQSHVNIEYIIMFHYSVKRFCKQKEQKVWLIFAVLLLTCFSDI